MALVNLPSGQIKLKEYAGGGSLLSDMWTSPAQRKRGNVEEVLKAFPESQWILIGDSGEQDLELFSSVAVQFPQQILGIFIRDVTTPMTIKQDDIQRGIKAAAAASVESLRESRRGLRSRVATSRKTTIPPNPVPPARQMSEPASDLLSPNNPLEQVDYALPRLVSGFYRRIAAAESSLPDGCLLRIFRQGWEVQEEALELIRSVQRQQAESDHS